MLMHLAEQIAHVHMIEIDADDPPTLTHASLRTRRLALGFDGAIPSAGVRGAYFYFSRDGTIVPVPWAGSNEPSAKDDVAKHRIVGISFDHMHMGDLLRAVAAHGDAEIAGIYDPDRAKMAQAIANFSIPDSRVFTDLETCLKQSGADLAIVCSATGAHAETVARIAPYGMHVLVEKPFAADVADARRMIAAMAPTGRRLAVNWPAAWSPGHNTAKRLVDDGTIGALIEVHYHGGNRGPLYHLADKVEVSPEEVEAQKPTSWWYRKAEGGGSLLDYLGYGATLGTWFMNGEAPVEVTAVVDETPGVEVDQHSITICRYRRGLSKFETKWGTLTDPWTVQTQPKCGFVLVGTAGTVSSYDYDDHVTLQTCQQPRQTPVPVDPLPAARRGPIAYMLDRIDRNAPIEGPLDPALSLIGQRIIDSALLSATSKRTVPLIA
jgi:glucose-fructose oxidoreductase